MLENMILLAEFVINSTSYAEEARSNLTKNLNQTEPIKYLKEKPLEEINGGTLKTDLFTPIFLVEKGRWKVEKKPAFIEIKNIHYVSRENKTIITITPSDVGEGNLTLLEKGRWKIVRKIYTVKVIPFEEKNKTREEAKEEKEALSLYKAAYELFKRSRYAEAERALKSLLKKYPDSSINETAMVLLSHSLIKLGKYSEALKTLEKVKPTAYSVLLQAEALYREGDIEGALIKASQSYHMNPEGETAPQALLIEGKALFKSGDCSQAAEVFKRIYRDFPKKSEAEEALFRLGEVFESRGCRDYELARYFYRKLLVEYPQSKWAFKARRKLEIIEKYLLPEVPSKP